MQPLDFANYEKILINVKQRIEENDGKKDKIVFKVPGFVIGFTAYNIKTCVAFLIKKLRDEMYSISYKSPHWIVMTGMQKKSEFIKKKRGRPRKEESNIVPLNDPILIDIINTIIPEANLVG